MEKKPRWYEKKEYWAATIFIVGGIKALTRPHTIAYQAADYSINIGIPLALGYLGVKNGYERNSLPSGLTKFMDKIPDSITGVRGSSNEKLYK